MDNREPVPQRCALCGAERTTLAWQAGGKRIVAQTCLDVRGCQERQEKEAE